MVRHYIEKLLKNAGRDVDTAKLDEYLSTKQPRLKGSGEMYFKNLFNKTIKGGLIHLGTPKKDADLWTTQLAQKKLGFKQANRILQMPSNASRKVMKYKDVVAPFVRGRVFHELEKENLTPEQANQISQEATQTFLDKAKTDLNKPITQDKITEKKGIFRTIKDKIKSIYNNHPKLIKTILSIAGITAGAVAIGFGLQKSGIDVVGIAQHLGNNAVENIKDVAQNVKAGVNNINWKAIPDIARNTFGKPITIPNDTPTPTPKIEDTGTITNNIPSTFQKPEIPDYDKIKNNITSSLKKTAKSFAINKAKDVAKNTFRNLVRMPEQKFEPTDDDRLMMTIPEVRQAVEDMQNGKITQKDAEKIFEKVRRKIENKRTETLLDNPLNPKLNS